MLSSASNTALSAMRAAEVAMQVTANNLANAQTDGFKASRVVYATQTPRRLQSGNNPPGGGNQVGTGVTVAEVSQNTDGGPITTGQSPLSLLLTGRGLFVLEGADGQQLYTQAGQFSFNAQGELVLPTGQRVLGYNADSNQQFAAELAPIRLPTGMLPGGGSPNRFSVDQDGVIRGTLADGTPMTIGQLARARFDNPNGLLQRENTLYEATAASGSPSIAEGETTKVLSGVRQLSNTNIAESLIDLSMASLLFRTNLEVIETEQEMLDDLLNLRK